MNKQFLDAIFTDGIQHPNFFNGRILTATDLREEQEANEKRSRYVAQATGTGVVYGLNVQPNPDNTNLRISAGLAINLRGDTLELPTNNTISLLSTQREALSDDAESPFAPCDLTGLTTVSGNIDTNYYMLAITSANRLSTQLAPNSGINGSSDHCTSRYEEIGVQFRLIPIIASFLTDTPENKLSESLRRSYLSHWCYGTQMIESKLATPLNFNQLDGHGLEDFLRQQQGRDISLSECDVPLAIFHYKNTSVQFVDMWSVRRPCQPKTRPLVYPTQYSRLPLAANNSFLAVSGLRPLSVRVIHLKQRHSFCSFKNR